MGRWCGHFAIAATLGLAIGCVRSGTFVCEGSSDCNDGSFTGMCQPSGYCSFGDASCESGQRYGDLAGDDLAGTCVPPIDGTTGGDLSTTGVGTTVSSLDGASLEGGDTTTTTTESGMLDGTLDGALEDTGTTTTTSDVTSADPTSVSLTDPETVDSGPTATDSSGECDDLGTPNGECDACVAEWCCEEALLCMQEEMCFCTIQCTSDGQSPDECQQQCGESEAYFELGLCLDAACKQVCTVN